MGILSTFRATLIGIAVLPFKLRNGLLRGLKLVFIPLLIVSSSALGSSCSDAFAAIMDPYGAGKLLKPELEDRGLTPIAVLGSEKIPKGYTFDPSEWKHAIVYSTPEQTAQAILEIGTHFKALYDGAESGTVKSASVREAIRSRGIPILGNSSRLAWARRDKEESAKVLRELAPLQFSSNRLEDVLQGAHSIGYPVVIKPNRNAGGTGVKMCWSDEEVISAFNAIGLGTGRLNEMLELDTAVIVQKAQRGPERAFNGYRDKEGTIVFSGFWEYEREARNGAPSVYVVDRLLVPHSKGLQRLAGKVEKAAERLEIDGPFHIETKGGKVIDAGARLSGGGLSILEGHGTDINPVKLTVDGYLRPDKIRASPRMYNLHSYVAAVFISSNGNATASHRLQEELEKMKAYGSVVDYEFHFSEGTDLKPTVDSDSIAASVLLRADSESERELKIEEILRWRDRGLFENRNRKAEGK
jgi:plasmid stabilization system protein ParE